MVNQTISNESPRNTYLLSVNVHSNKVKLSTENKYHRNWYPSQSVLSEQSLSKSKCTIRTKSIKVKVYYQNKVYQSRRVLSEQSLSKSMCTIRTKSIKVNVYYQNKVYQSQRVLSEQSLSKSKLTPYIVFLLSLSNKSLICLSKLDSYVMVPSKCHDLHII
jgi:hypothetical protein